MNIYNKNKQDEIIILECKFCMKDHEWNKTREPHGIGYCNCRTGRFLKSIGKNQMYKVRKERKPYVGGHVIVQSSNGFQRLKPPFYRENPDNWSIYTHGSNDDK